MNILVVGCGKVGSRLAIALSKEGHDVSVVEKDEANMELLGDEFVGFKTIGIPIDLDLLKEAGIESCDAVAAVSQDDNVNIMVSQVASQIFKVPRVLARIYDPKREDVFSHFGLHTVCPTNLTVSAVRSALTEPEIPKMLNFGAHTISFVTVPVESHLYDSQVSDLALEDNHSVFAVLHSDLLLTMYDGQSLKLKHGDKLIVAVVVD